jgi:prepilin-type N-terminal cleavage/methylation domain-containing protein
MKTPKIARLSGFTLLELMIVMFIMTVLAGYGTPVYMFAQKDNVVEENARNFLSLLNRTRLDAIKRGVPVYLYPTSQDTDWESGWVKYRSGIAENIVIDNPVDIENEMGVSAIRFDSRGRIYDGFTLNNLNNVSFLFCDIDGDSEIEGRRIAMNFIGRIQVTYVNEC